MRILITTLALLVLLATGCTQRPPPKNPTYKTEASKACARDCQLIYSQCNIPCSETRGGAMGAGQRRACFNKCAVTLEDCYSTCE